MLLPWNIATYALAAALAGSVTANFITHGRLQSERLEHQRTKATYSALVAATEKTRADEEASRRKAEQELEDAQTIHAAEFAAVHLDLDRAADRAAGESGRLRDAAQAAAASARAQCAATTAAQLRDPAGDPIGVLADVLGRADAAAGQLADLADRRGAAGRACEQAYNDAREKLRAH